MHSARRAIRKLGLSRVYVISKVKSDLAGTIIAFFVAFDMVGEPEQDVLVKVFIEWFRVSIFQRQAEFVYRTVLNLNFEFVADLAAKANIN